MNVVNTQSEQHSHRFIANCERDSVDTLTRRVFSQFQNVYAARLRAAGLLTSFLMALTLLFSPTTSGVAGASNHGLSLANSTCTQYDYATHAQRVKFVKSWDHELTIVPGNQYLSTGLGVMLNYCLPEGRINTSDESIGQLLFDAALIG